MKTSHHVTAFKIFLAVTFLVGCKTTGSQESEALAVRSSNETAATTVQDKAPVKPVAKEECNISYKGIFQRAMTANHTSSEMRPEKPIEVELGGHKFGATLSMGSRVVGSSNAFPQLSTPRQPSARRGIFVLIYH